VIVLYHPPADIRQRITRLLTVIRRVYVVDNTPEPHNNRELLGYLTPAMPGLTYLNLHANQGIATALNFALAQAKAIPESGLHWLLMLDQDSDPPESLLTDLSAAIASVSAANREKLALIGISYHDPDAVPSPVPRSSLPLIPVKAVITSGSLLRLDAAAIAGNFRDDYFIDEVDHEYALRLRKAGFQVALAPGISMPHSLGHMRRVRLPGLTIGVSNHPPSRRYYMARNRVTLTKTYLFFDPLFVLSRLALTLWESLIIVLFESQKSSKLFHTLKGITHGILGRMGPLRCVP
jgi:rhamnosyltransferase